MQQLGGTPTLVFGELDLMSTTRPYDVRLWQAQGMCYEELGLLVNPALFYLLLKDFAVL